MPTQAIASICYGGFPGSNRCMRELARATGLARHLVTTEDPGSRETAFYVGLLDDLAPELVLFGSWHKSYEPVADAARRKGARVGVLWTSSPIQTDIGGEVAVLTRVLADARVSLVLFLSRGFEGLGTGAKMTFARLPPLVAVPKGSPPARTSHARPPVVSLFCPPAEGRRKNTLACLLALARLRCPYLLLLNGLTAREEYRVMLEPLGIDYEDRGWMTDAEYALTLRSVEVGLQVSLAESFGYVVADHLLAGAPVLVTPMVQAALLLSAETRARLTISNPDDPGEIAERLGSFLEDATLRWETGTRAREELVQALEGSAAEAREVLLGVLSGQRQGR
jgi:glycosyltransferase involved in cell wall biosynthesis